MKKIFLSLIVFLSAAACSEEPNSFTPEANVFLDSIDGKSYKGVNSSVGITYAANGTILAEHHSDASIPNIALRFMNSKDNGVSETEAVYQQTRDPKQFRGIKIENGGKTLYRTPLAATEAAIAWNNYEQFAVEQ